MRGFVIGLFPTDLLLVGLMEFGGEAHADSRDLVTAFDGGAASFDGGAASTPAFGSPHSCVGAGRL